MSEEKDQSPAARLVAAPTPHIGDWLRLMIHELVKQAEWGHAAGSRVLDGSESVWTDLQLLSSHAGSVAAFVDSLGMRAQTLANAYPARPESLRLLSGTTFDFDPTRELRNAIAHIDERLELRWLQLAELDSAPPELSARSVNNNSAESIIRLDESKKTVSVLSQSGKKRHEINIRELTEELSRLQQQATQAWLWLTFRPGPSSST